MAEKKEVALPTETLQQGATRFPKGAPLVVVYGGVLNRLLKFVEERHPSLIALHLDTEKGEMMVFDGGKNYRYTFTSRTITRNESVIATDVFEVAEEKK